MTVQDDDFRTLMDGVLAGTPGAAERLCQNYQSHILRVVRRRLMNRLRTRFDSLDLVQEVWASFFAAPPSNVRFDDPQALISYLERMTQHKVAECTRQQTGKKQNLLREQPLEVPGADPGQHLVARQPTASQEFYAHERWERMLRGVLPQHRRILVFLRQGLTYREIADRLQTNEKSIQRLVRHLLRRIPDA